MGKFSSSYQQAADTQKAGRAFAQASGRPTAPVSNRGTVVAAGSRNTSDKGADLARKLQEEQLAALKNGASSASPSTPWSTGGRKNRNG